MKNKKHLPLFGVGPIYVASIIIITVMAAILNKNNIIPKVEFIKPVMTILGAFFILGGFIIWLTAVLKTGIAKGILENHLVTSGAYAYVRNPIYSAFMFGCTGALICCNNLVLLILPFVYWAYMTVLMINTEEKWLLDLYGKEYEEYCKKVNRCIPIKRRSK